MQITTVRIEEIIRDPLAGCLDIIHSPGAYPAILDSLFNRLCLRYRKKIARIILSQIEIESRSIFILKKEYVVNELQYEIRGDFISEKEAEFINQWAINLSSKISTDGVLEFITDLKIYRSKRIRN